MKVTLRQRSGFQNEVPRQFDVTKEGGATNRQDPTVAKLAGQLRDFGDFRGNVSEAVKVARDTKKASCVWTQDAFLRVGDIGLVRVVSLEADRQDWPFIF